MSDTYISAALRREVFQRAGGCCEYCRTGENDSAINFVIDHVIAEKHGGSTAINNLCLSCYWCNSYKGSDLSSVDWDDEGQVVPLFNPQQQHWESHFNLENEWIQPLTAVGRVTIFLLRLNSRKRLDERELLVLLDNYPCEP